MPVACYSGSWINATASPRRIHLHPDLKSNAEDYQRSLELMLSLEADILCEGRFGVYSREEGSSGVYQAVYGVICSEGPNEFISAPRCCPTNHLVNVFP
jgi:hypothetical protein